MFDTTLVFLRRDGEILLGMKKRGFGKGRWNGIGGKVDAHEEILAAAVREVQEEINVQLAEKDLVHVATLEFIFKEKPEWNQRMCVYTTTTWNGQPQESEEMLPQWFRLDAIPYENMWVDDQYWIPLVLKNTFVEATFWLSADGQGQQLEKMEFTKPKGFVPDIFGKHKDIPTWSKQDRAQVKEK